MDSSIRLKTNYLEPLLSIVKSTGIIGHMIKVGHSCSTNSKMFDWFKINETEIGMLYQLQAGINVYHRNFLNTLIMKAWITCAFDKSCIAPDGRQDKHSCNDCDCHRYDQSALTTVTTYFFEMSNSTQKQYVRAAHAVYTNTAYYDILRGHKMEYFAQLDSQSY